LETNEPNSHSPLSCASYADKGRRDLTAVRSTVCTERDNLDSLQGPYEADNSVYKIGLPCQQDYTKSTTDHGTISSHCGQIHMSSPSAACFNKEPLDLTGQVKSGRFPSADLARICTIRDKQIDLHLDTCHQYPDVDYVTYIPSIYR
jgi:hypothetical protein